MSMTDREKRLGLHLPVEVSGVDAASADFTEKTRSLNISGGGICFESQHHILVGTRVTLKIRLPPALRPHFGGKEVYQVRAVICREENFEGEAAHRVGARFLSEAEEGSAAGKGR